jgi:hypothetical protein
VSCENGAVCCGGDRIIVNATYDGGCPPTLFIQVDMESSGEECTLCDDNPAGVEGCDDQCSMDGVSVQAFCSRWVCTGYYTMPYRIYTVQAAECRGETVVATAAATYVKGLPCDGGGYYEPPDTVGGSVYFGEQSECVQQCVLNQD